MTCREGRPLVSWLLRVSLLSTTRLKWLININALLPQRDQCSTAGSQEPEQAQSATVSMARELGGPRADGAAVVSSCSCSPPPKIGDTLSPAAATTAEEAMSVSQEARASSRDARVLPGDLGASGGAVPLGGDMAAVGAEGGREESAGESEAWAAAVPPVRLPHPSTALCFCLQHPADTLCFLFA